MSLNNKNTLETQIQYKMIEKLSRMNKDLKEEILKRKLKEGELEKERRRLEAALEQKELLLREVNHRVKNNLQVVKSLLSVQVDLSESGEVADALDAFSGRLDSLVSLHTLLYQSDATGDISLLKFVEEIFNGVFDDRVDLRLECVDHYVYFEKLSTLGMILHEIATNSCKHAWKRLTTNSLRNYYKLQLLCRQNGGGGFAIPAQDTFSVSSVDEREVRR